jgi:hypothetical protein
LSGDHSRGGAAPNLKLAKYNSNTAMYANKIAVTRNVWLIGVLEWSHCTLNTGIIISPKAISPDFSFNLSWISIRRILTGV